MWYSREMKSIVFVALVLMIGCDDAPSSSACTEEARSSVVLKIQDSATEEILDTAIIEYSVDNGTPKDVICDNDETGLHYCGSLVLEYEVKGVFEFTISSPGYVDQTKTVTIEKTEDGCHVIGKTLTVNMVTL